MNLIKKIILKIIKKIYIFNFKNTLYVILNISYYFLLRTYNIYILGKKSTEELLYKQLLINLEDKNSNSFNYFFELFSFLDFFQEENIQEKFINSTGDVLINIGSNIGRNGYLIARYNDNIKETILIDPNPFVFKILENFGEEYKKYLKLNLVLLNVGVSDDLKSASFYFPKNNLSGIGTLEKDFIHEADLNEIKVDLVNFQYITNLITLKEYSKVLILIDVEGHEYNVLKSILEYLILDKKDLSLSIIVEIWENNLSKIEELLNHYSGDFKVSLIEKLTDIDYYLEIKKN